MSKRRIEHDTGKENEVGLKIKCIQYMLYINMTCPGHNPITHQNSQHKRRLKKTSTNTGNKAGKSTQEPNLESCDKVCVTLFGGYKICLASQEEIHKVVFF